MESLLCDRNEQIDMASTLGGATTVGRVLMNLDVMLGRVGAQASKEIAEPGK